MILWYAFSFILFKKILFYRFGKSFRLAFSFSFFFFLFSAISNCLFAIKKFQLRFWFFFHQVSELGCLDFVQNMTFTWNHQLANFILKIFWPMRLNIEEGCLSYDHQWNALMALSNCGNSCNYYWLARRNGRTCFVIAVIIKSLVWFAFCLLKCSLEHHYVSFCSYYCYIIFFLYNGLL